MRRSIIVSMGAALVLAGLPWPAAAGLPATLDLTLSDDHVLYKKAVTLTVHLDQYANTEDKEVEIYRTPYGDQEELFATGMLDADGDFAADVVARQRTEYVARWAGDDQYDAAESPVRELLVRVALTTDLKGSYDRAGRYLLFHAGDDPRYLVKVLPDHSGDLVHMTTQWHRSGRWQTAARDQVALDGRNIAELVLHDFPPQLRFRIRGQFRYDGDHLGDRSGWTYFRYT